MRAKCVPEAFMMRVEIGSQLNPRPHPPLRETRFQSYVVRFVLLRAMLFSVRVSLLSLSSFRAGMRPVRGK